MNEYVFAVFIIGLPALCLAVNWTRWFGSPEAKSWAARDDWERRRRAEGATSDDIHAESHMRENLARLRRVCSDAVHASPQGRETWIETMKQEIEISVMVLNSLDPALGRRFLKMVSDLRHSDILYPDAYDVVYPPPGVVRLSRGQRQALAHDRLAAYTDL